SSHSSNTFLPANPSCASFAASSCRARSTEPSSAGAARRTRLGNGAVTSDAGVLANRARSLERVADAEKEARKHSAMHLGVALEGPDPRRGLADAPPEALPPNPRRERDPVVQNRLHAAIEGEPIESLAARPPIDRRRPEEEPTRLTALARPVPRPNFARPGGH